MRVHEVTLELHPKVVRGIKDHAKKEAKKGGYEAVGIMARKPRRDDVHALVPLHNHAPNPQEAFFVEPWEQFRAERDLAEQGLEIVGVYHSHANSEALPSMMDHNMARPGEFVVIYSVPFDELRGYMEEDGTLTVVELA